MIAFPDAQALIVGSCGVLGTETVALDDAPGRVVGETLRATGDLVPYARSAMDGYAVHAADVASLPARLPVSGAVYAAPATQPPLHRRGTAMAIATGGALPAGADAVIPFEDVVAAAGAIVVNRAVRPGDAVFPPGDDARRGDTLVESGITVTPGILGLLAAAGVSRLAVRRRPLVTVLCGGDELVPIEIEPGYGQIRNSNAPLIVAALERFGAAVRATHTLPDDLARVHRALQEAVAASDLVVTTGGASVGERDFVKSACREAGVRFAFDTVALRPAKPTAFGHAGSTAVAVLPGNPAAAFVALHEFVRPAVRAMTGARDVRLPRIVARLNGTIHAKPERHFAAFAALDATVDGLVARPLDNQCSSLTRGVAQSCGFIIVPPGPQRYASGDRIAFDVVDWTRLGTPA